MATVYLAHDLRYDRPVAFKLLRPEISAGMNVERFRREIATAARLQHPHICSVYDSGEDDGQLWFTMPYVRGETLRARLRRQGRLPVADALRITREAAEALGHAHRSGIVHRDVKPENILLTEDGSPMLADFGIALHIDKHSGEHLTEQGHHVGTPMYMAPEQAMAERAGPKADQFALAAVCYEMLAGAPPHAGPTIHATLARRLSKPAPGVRSYRSDTPESVERALARALAMTPADRFPSIDAFADALAPGAQAARAPRPPLRLDRGRLGGDTDRGRPVERRLPAVPAGRVGRHARRRARRRPGGARGPARRAPLRQPGRQRRRLLRRRHDGRAPRQARRPPRSRSHRPRQLEPVPAERQDAGPDRRRARRAVPAHGHGAVGERREAEPGAGEPRADRGQHGRDPLAAAVRGRVHRRVRRAGADRRRGGGRAAPGPGGLDPRAAHRPADAEPRGLCPLPPEPGAPLRRDLLRGAPRVAGRAGGGGAARSGVRRRLGGAVAGAGGRVPPRRAHGRRRRGGPRVARAGPGARARLARRARGPGPLQARGRGRLRRRAAGLPAGAPDAAQPERPAERGRRGRAGSQPLRRGGGRPRARGPARSPLARRRGRPRRRLPPAPPVRRGAAGDRSRRGRSGRPA